MSCRELMATSKEPITFSQDGRLPIKELTPRYDQLVGSGYFTKELIFVQEGLDLNNTSVKIPVYGYLSTTQSVPGESLWILGGIHGEEPAGPNAIAASVPEIIKLVQAQIPIVVIPLLNPLGYIRDDRYFNAHRMEPNGSSIGDQEFLLNRADKPANPYAAQFGNWVAKTAPKYLPLLLFDHHEDELDHSLPVIDAHQSYSYCYGPDTSTLSSLSAILSAVLVKNGFPVSLTGETRFGEKIVNGFVQNSQDGSVDELLAQFGLRAGFVIETTRDDSVPIKLETRIATHQNVIGLYQEFWEKIHRQ